MLVRPGGTVGVGDVDIGFGEGTANSCEFSRTIQDFENNHFLFHHVKLFLFQKEEGLGGIIHQKTNHGVVHRVVDSESQNINPCFGKDRTRFRKKTRTILEEDRQLLLDFIQEKLLGLHRHPADDLLSQRNG